MKKTLSKKEAKRKIHDFFNRKKLAREHVKKMKRLAMKHKIRLREYKKRFCKKCFFDLENGKVRMTKHYKSIECLKCKFKNRWKIKIS